MNDHEKLDAPIDNPDDDLLGMADYANTLAGYILNIDPPFTVGVYGEWGEGKTSFVNLLHKAMEAFSSNEKVPGQRVKFISFTAWPYTTSDELWRALLLKIARDLHGEPEPANRPTTGDQTSDIGQQVDNLPRTSIVAKIDRFLESQLDILKPDTNIPKETDYEKFVARLDQNLYGSISRRSEQQMQVNQEMALAAVAKGLVEALGSISPLVSGLKNLFGFKTEINLTDIVRDRNQTTRETIKSKSEFQALFKELFDTFEKKEPQNREARVIVFVDDLDRCLPDVALDLLEAIKVFFEEVRCVFLVAADERLIGQGLRMRYKDLFESSRVEQADEYLAKKGQEYFEKVIQLGVRVPSRSPTQGQRFVAAQFPTWMPAADILQAGVGNNPRRLKQYCRRLNFTHDVARRYDTGQ